MDMLPVCQDGSPLDGNASKSSLMGNNWHVSPIMPSLEEHLEGHTQILKNELRSCLQEDLRISGVHAKLFDLGEKVSSSHWNPPKKTSSSVSIPLKSGGTFAELQQKVGILKSQLIEERSQRQAVGRQLYALRCENDKDLQHKQKIWENKFREVQKEKYMLSVRVQKLEMESPRQRLAQGADVHLTEEELQLIRQEIKEQESLIRGYQIENERAVEKLREVQRDAKEKERLMEEQNTALASQLASLQASGGLKLSKEEVYTSLTESLTLRAEILNAKTREEALMSEIEKIKSEKKVLEMKIIDFEKMQDEKKNTEDALDASCQCMMVSNNGSEVFFSNTCELNERAGNINGFEAQKLENYGDKENFVHSERNFQILLSEEGEKNESLQKRIEKMKREYDLKIKDLKQQIENKRMPPQNIVKASTKRVKELEAQINDIRSFYTKKLKELSNKADESIMKKPGEKITINSPKTGNVPKTSKALKLSQKRVALLEESLKEKTEMIKYLQENFLSTMHKQGTTVSEESCAGNLRSDICKEISSKDELIPCSPENMSFDKVQSSARLDTSDASQLQTIKVEEVAGISLSEGQNQVSRKGFNNLAQTATCMYPPQQPKKMTGSDSVSFKDEISCTSKGHQYNNIPEPRMPRHDAMEDKINLVQETAMPSLEQSQQLEVLQKKVQEMEARQKHRELEWQALLIDTKRLLSLEHDMAERKWELAMEAKNAEINRFKLELDTILEVAIKLQRAQLNIS